MPGYDYAAGKSNNAVDAEMEGRYPLTSATKIVSRALGISQKSAKETILSYGSSEWHHCSRGYNRVDYYDTSAIIDAVRGGDHAIVRPIPAPKAASWRTEVTTLRIRDYTRSRRSYVPCYREVKGWLLRKSNSPMLEVHELGKSPYKKSGANVEYVAEWHPLDGTEKEQNS